MRSADFYASRPHKRIAAGALFLNQHEEILILQSPGDGGWMLPGGTSEHGESPRETCIREIREEIGIPCIPGRLLCVAYDHVGHGGVPSESIKFIFDGGILDEKAIETIVIDPREVVTFQFVSYDVACTRLNERIVPRLIAAMKARTSGILMYLEDGVLVS